VIAADGESAYATPIWCVLTYKCSTSPSGPGGIWWVRSDGAGKPQLLIQGKNTLVPFSFTTDGKRLAYHEVNPVYCRSFCPTTRELTATDKSVNKRVAKVSSLTLVDSVRSVPAHNHPACIAIGLKVSNRTVFPNPLRPVRTRFFSMVSSTSNFRNSLVSFSRPAKFGRMWPAPGLNGFFILVACSCLLISAGPPPVKCARTRVIKPHN
jgi:hypothetical protein